MHTSYKSNLRKVAGAVAVAAFALLSFVGCKDDKTDDATTLTLSPTSLSFTAEAESKQVTIKTSVSAEQLAAVPDA